VSVKFEWSNFAYTLSPGSAAHSIPSLPSEKGNRQVFIFFLLDKRESRLDQFKKSL
jgi:hypothetical protein